MNNTINKNGWLYKFNKWINKNSDIVRTLENGWNVSLCQYFWLSVWNILVVTPIKAIVLIVWSVFMLAAFWWLVANPIVSLFALYTGIGLALLTPESILVGLIAIFLFYVLLPLLLGGLAYKDGDINFAPEYMKRPFRSLIKKVTPLLPEKKESAPKKPKEPNIVWQYLKAKKEKMCPMLKLSA